MKKIISSSNHLIISLLVIFFFAATSIYAAPLKNIPIMVMQPNGDRLNCYASGDEFYNYLHDKDGFTIIQNDEGYYMYAIYDEDNNIIPSQFVAGNINPLTKELQANVLISNEEYQARRAAWFNYEDIPRTKNADRNHGTINNLVVFIRFSDEGNITSPISTFENIFNNQTPGYNSMINYFQTASYGKLNIPSHFYPQPEGNSVLSYQDIHPRSYYQPYNATTNPNGYQGGDHSWERTEREHKLLKRAVEHIAHMVPSDLIISNVNENYVDNICFIVKGVDDDWANLLWPHRWVLYSEYAYINGKRVWDYNFITEAGYFNNAVLCHEMQHTLNYPDFYHYGHSGSPCGTWDIMEANPNPPQQSGAYAKWKYGNWLNEPTVIQPGKYTLNSIGNGVGFVSYKIPTNDPQQFFVLEYRNSNDLFENFWYGDVAGMLVYRINTRWNGNAQYNHSTIFDEVFIFRPNADYPFNDGSLNIAHFGQGGRTTFNATTDPKPTLTNGTIITDLSITDITVTGNKVSFTYNNGTTQFYGVAFHSNGGKGNMLPQMFEAGVAQNLRENSFTFEEREFLGWALTSDGEVEYENNQSIAIEGNIVLYAVWTPALPVYYTITASVIYTLCWNNGCGTIDPEGEIEVLENTSQTFIIQAESCKNPNSFISQIYVDGAPVYNPQNEEEKYRIEYTFENVTANHTIEVHFGCLGINENKKTNVFFSIQPNPATQYFEIALSPSDLTSSGVTAQIYDVQGLLLKTVQLYTEKTKIDISNLTKGFYIVKIGKEAKKLIVK
ncbi:MAG: InlB B-repeat-containing protein [Bacteroidetes bacterium]|nr:InlB B-repeat-containing protein [Bacteroidota bacterium]MCL2303296.1 InlB B-repeat-containing protein [Lentimicrobiaceae bacterium]